MDLFKEKYNKLSAIQKTRAKQGLAISIFIIVMFLAFVNKEQEIKVDTQKYNETQVEEVSTDESLFESDLTEEVNEKLEKQQKEQNKEIEDLRKLIELSAKSDAPKTNKQPLNNSIQGFPMPPTTAPEERLTQPPQINTFDENGQAIPQQWIGGIVHEEYEVEHKLNSNEIKDAQKKRVVKLPPSFMDGFLLTGMDAMTIEGSQDTPEPMMIRVQAPAVLPNDVKANLKGCFVIAEGYGSLATHRVDARLRTLSCVDLKGGSVIHEKITGYVQDLDGKRGIKGIVVHRAGALVARSMIAGAFEGIGSAVTSSAQTTSISALGQTNNTESGSLGKSALGGGISAGAKDVRALFLQLAKQSSPVVEIGAAKKISVVITGLVELKIQEL